MVWSIDLFPNNDTDRVDRFNRPKCLRPYKNLDNYFKQGLRENHTSYVPTFQCLIFQAAVKFSALSK